MDPSHSLPLAAFALALEAALGYPDALYRAIGHPVTWIGGLIARLDAGWNREADPQPTRRRAGVAALVVLLVVCGGAGVVASRLLGDGVWGAATIALLASSLIAQRSLDTHVAAVRDGLAQGLDQGRAAVAMIVGRDTAVLDEAGVARAAIESLAENFSDGVVAPAFWLAVLGLPGIVAYKAVNTADSMIGHRDARHAAFGWAAARFDDLVNLPASRLAALWLVAAAAITPGASAPAAWRAVWRDARRHRSPNAGWPEAAMAGALGLRLAGPRVYSGALVADAFMGEGRREATTGDLTRALALYRTACRIELAVVIAAALIARG